MLGSVGTASGKLSLTRTRRCCNLHCEMKLRHRESSGLLRTIRDRCSLGLPGSQTFAFPGLEGAQTLRLHPLKTHMSDLKHWIPHHLGLEAQKQDPEDEDSKQIEGNPQITLERGFFLYWLEKY